MPEYLKKRWNAHIFGRTLFVHGVNEATIEYPRRDSTRHELACMRLNCGLEVRAFEKDPLVGIVLPAQAMLWWITVPGGNAVDWFTCGFLGKRQQTVSPAVEKYCREWGYGVLAGHKKKPHGDRPERHDRGVDCDYSLIFPASHFGHKSVWVLTTVETRCVTLL
jgi:hypothetical protein